MLASGRRVLEQAEYSGLRCAGNILHSNQEADGKRPGSSSVFRFCAVGQIEALCWPRAAPPIISDQKD